LQSVLFEVIKSIFMKNFLILGLTMLMASVVFGQIPEANWNQSVDKSKVSVGEVIDVTFKTDIPDGYNIYSNKFDYVDCGPQKARFQFDLTGASLIGEAEAIGAHFHSDELWEMVCGEGEIADFKNKGEFRQKIKILSNEPIIKGRLDYQMCTEDGMCVTFKHKFSIDNLLVSEPSKVVTPSTVVPNEKPNKITNDNPQGTQVNPTETGKTDVSTKETTQEGIAAKDTIGSEVLPSSAKDSLDNVAEELKEADNKDDLKSMSLWALFLLGVGGGLLALVTPCVFPMIPMTVAFFTKETDRKKGILKGLFYGASIVGIYLVLGLILAKVFDEKFTYMLSTHWLPNILFFGIFVFFALSFFGMFELTLPSSFVNKMDAKGDKGGYIGIFFIAFTLVLVSFSCTVPIVGSVSILAAGGETLRPLIAMLGFALTFAFPFVLFAVFPAWLNGLPKSGGWLNSVKVVLGFVELALALKFLSQADLVYNWGILDRDVFIAIWVVLAMLLGLYLLGKIKFPHDSDLPRIPVLRFLFAVIVFSFGLWMLPGMWGAPLKPLAGLLPPLTTQDYVVTSGGVSAGHSESSGIRFSDELHVPQGLTGYFTLDEALAEAKKQGKPLFVDFTGKSCANCRKMEENVWPDSGVLSRLKNDFVIASLYCDAWGIELPEAEWGKDGDGDVLKSLGEVNSQLQIDQFGSNGQPFYYVIDHNEKVLSTFSGYENNAPKYIKFLDKGKKAFYAK
jgi:thiol:disulfide interchange protein